MSVVVVVDVVAVLAPGEVVAVAAVLAAVVAVVAAAAAVAVSAVPAAIDAASVVPVIVVSVVAPVDVAPTLTQTSEDRHAVCIGFYGISCSRGGDGIASLAVTVLLRPLLLRTTVQPLLWWRSLFLLLLLLLYDPLLGLYLPVAPVDREQLKSNNIEAAGLMRRTLLRVQYSLREDES